MSLIKLYRCYDGLCGAEDCPRCNPGCGEIIICPRCGREEYACYIDGWEMDRFNAYSGVCPECKAETKEDEE